MPKITEDQIKKALPLVPTDDDGDPHWQQGVWARIDRGEARRKPWRVPAVVLTVLLALVAAIVLLGCAANSPPGYDLEGVHTIELAHSADALRIVAASYGTGERPTVHWAIDPLPPDPNGEAVDGVALGCNLWVEWWGEQWTSGASADGPATSCTALAHEVAHCVLGASGEDDPHHERADWWGPGGRVERARAALIAAGL